MKLQAKDLMIGDWVYIKDHSIKSQPQKVKPEHFVRSLVEFEPIPLTKKILEKNFVVERHNKYIQWSPCENCNTCFNIQIFINSTIIEGLFEYVHELQHALRLCRIEKQIEL